MQNTDRIKWQHAVVIIKSQMIDSFFKVKVFLSNTHLTHRLYFIVLNSSYGSIKVTGYTDFTGIIYLILQILRTISQQHIYYYYYMMRWSVSFLWIGLDWRAFKANKPPWLVLDLGFVLLAQFAAFF